MKKGVRRIGRGLIGKLTEPYPKPIRNDEETWVDEPMPLQFGRARGTVRNSLGSHAGHIAKLNKHMGL